jgi:hypothetical protein
MLRIQGQQDAYEFLDAACAVPASKLLQQLLLQVCITFRCCEGTKIILKDNVRSLAWIKLVL